MHMQIGYVFTGKSFQIEHLERVNSLSCFLGASVFSWCFIVFVFSSFWMQSSNWELSLTKSPMIPLLYLNDNWPQQWDTGLFPFRLLDERVLAHLHSVAGTDEPLYQQ